jgi:hypothetical protein
MYICINLEQVYLHSVDRQTEGAITLLYIYNTNAYIGRLNVGLESTSTTQMKKNMTRGQHEKEDKGQKRWDLSCLALGSI